MTKYVGKNIPRLDGFDKATGRGLYTADIHMPGMLYAAVLRSPYAHARIVSVDSSEATKMSGVVAVACKDNTPRTLFNTSATMVTTIPGQEPVLDQQIFPDVVRYIGDEVAAVAAETEEIALRALKKIKIQYEELPAVYDPVEAMKEGAPQVQPDISPGNNLCGTVVRIRYGDVDSAWNEGDVFAETEVHLPRVKQAQLETHGAVAVYNPVGTLSIYSTTQTPYPTKMIVSRALGIAESKIQIANPPYVGGGFGVRIGISGKAELVAAILSMLSSKPVKYIYSRQEDFIASDTRHGGIIRARLAAKKDGTFLALDTTAILNTGAYATFGVELLGVTGACGTAGTYRIPNIRYDGYPIYTNQQTAGAFRGFGTPQGSFAVETLVDDIAKQIGMDPLEIRLKNITRTGDKWWFPFPISSTHLQECLEQAAASVGWHEKRGRKQSGSIRRGVGIACGTHVSNAAPFCVDYDAAYMRIESDGSLHVSSSIPEIGPGSTTGILQIAAETVGVPFEKCRMVFGNTDCSPFDIGSHATRTLYTVGNLMIKMGKDLKRQILEWAAEYLHTSISSLDIQDGAVIGNCESTRFCTKPLPLSEIAYEAHIRGKQFLVHGCEIPPNSPPWHAHAAEVEVDIETGMVKVIKVAAAHDIGVAVNPILVEGQIEGGVAMGVGWATREEMTYQEGKGFYNDGFHKYMLPTMDEMPEIDTIIVNSTDPNGPFGAKGIGECGVIPTAPAIVSAVEDAIGIRFYEIPLTPGRVLKKIREVYGKRF